jgi:hypothetical protein
MMLFIAEAEVDEVFGFALTRLIINKDIYISLGTCSKWHKATQTLNERYFGRHLLQLMEELCNSHSAAPVMEPAATSTPLALLTCAGPAADSVK